VRLKSLLAGTTSAIIGLSGKVVALDPKDLPALQAAVHEFCVQPDRKGDYLKIEGDLDAGATLKIVGLGATGKITKETWDGINQRLDQYKLILVSVPFQLSVYLRPFLQLLLKSDPQMRFSSLSPGSSLFTIDLPKICKYGGTNSTGSQRKWSRHPDDYRGMEITIS